MSLTANFINQAAAKAAHAAASRLNLNDWTAGKLTPVAASLVLHGLNRRIANPVGAVALSLVLRRNPEDLLARARRLADADIRARGEVFLDRALGRHRARSQSVIADLALIDERTANAVLAMTAAAIVSALAKARRDLGLGVLELQGVVKSQSAAIDNADPQLVIDILDWVFRPPFYVRLWNGLRSLFQAPSGSFIEFAGDTGDLPPTARMGAPRLFS